MAVTTPVSVLSEKIRGCKALAFDFDGTLVDSNPIKRGAFDICFSEYSEHAEAIRDYCSRFNHTPRWEKFQYVVEKILKQPYTEERSRELHKRYEDATTRQVIETPEIPGAMDFLKSLRSCPVLLLSSTPHPILMDILKARGMTSFFAGIQGAPVNKAEWLRQYRETQRLQPENLLFFGDTPEDAAAARQAGWTFVAVANPQIQDGAVCYLDNYRTLELPHP